MRLHISILHFVSASLSIRCGGVSDDNELALKRMLLVIVFCATCSIGLEYDETSSWNTYSRAQSDL